MQPSIKDAGAESVEAFRAVGTGLQCRTSLWLQLRGVALEARARSRVVLFKKIV